MEVVDEEAILITTATMADQTAIIALEEDVEAPVTPMAPMVEGRITIVVRGDLHRLHVEVVEGVPMAVLHPDAALAHLLQDADE